MNSHNLNEIRLKIANLVEEYANHSLKPIDFVKGETSVPPSGKLIDSDELKSMVEASLDGWLTTGRFNEKFENQLAEFLVVKHLLTVNSGSSANLVAFNTLTSPNSVKKQYQLVMKLLVSLQDFQPLLIQYCNLVVFQYSLTQKLVLTILM